MGLLALAHAPHHDLVDQLDEPFLYHDPTRKGFISIVTPSRTPRQVSFRLRDMPERLQRVRDQGIDTYIGQHEFSRPNRRLVDCARLTSHYVDLDTYKLDALQGRDPEYLRDALLMACEDASIPYPTVVVFSGRGLQSKWVLNHPVPSAVLPRWREVQSVLCRRLLHLGADAKALDASRVLRLVGTTNSRSGDTVREVYRANVVANGATRRIDGALVYDFDVFADTVLPLARAELERRRAQRAELMNVELDDKQGRDEVRRAEGVMGSSVDAKGDPSAKNHTGYPLVPSKLAWDRLGDLRRLAALRGWQGGVPPGNRDAFLFLGAAFLAASRLASSFSAEVETLARQFAPTWSAQERRSCVSSVVALLEATRRGEELSFGGRRVDPQYRFRNETLVDWLSISADEQKEMTCIIGTTEARLRDAARKRRERAASGCLSRENYLAQADEKRQAARALQQRGMNQAQIAVALAISPATASRYCRS